MEFSFKIAKLPSAQLRL